MTSSIERSEALLRLRECDCSPTCDLLVRPKLTAETIATVIDEAVADAVAAARRECREVALDVARATAADGKSPYAITTAEYIALRIAVLGQGAA